MKVLERNVLRLAVVQHIRSVYGIKIKNWNKTRNKGTSANTTRVFGVPLDALPHCHVLDYGEIPCFMADVCSCLLQHVGVEGLFRRSGSVLRVRSLRAKLDQGEDCLSTALPLDLAGLLKQFFRELPEPVLSVDLHSALLKAQELPTEEDRTSATALLSCVLPDQNLSTLRYFFSFLKSVSQRSAENKMDSSNLSVIFAPNLFHCADGAEKLSSGTEKKLKLQAAAVQRLIDHAQNIGVVPQFLMEKVPVMLGCDPGLISPSSESVEENNNQSGQKKSSRRSLGDVVSGALSKLRSGRTPGSPAECERAVFSMATPVIMTPNSKRKLPTDLPHSHGFSSKKRRSIKMNLGLELFPSALFGGSSTPGSAHSAAGALDSSMSSCSSARRKSRRLRDRVSRVESGKAGCFSPRVSKKEAVRKSLRLRFSLSKSSRECNTITHSQLGPKGSEVIGWRLATQESGSGFHFTKEPAFSPAVLEQSPARGSWKFLDKAEDELPTPRSDPFRETSSRALAQSTLPIILCCAPTGPEPLSDQHSSPEATVPSVRPSRGLVQQQMEREPELVPRPASEESSASSPTPGAEETFHQFQMVPMTPLHIDSTLFEGLAQSSQSGCLDHDGSFFREGCSGDCSRLIDALDIQSPVAFRLESSSRGQSTPCAPRTQTRTSSEESEERVEQNIPETRRMKVADQIKLFNTMTLNSPKARRLRSPLKFQRTPVRQSVRRLDSLLGCVPQDSPVVKALSLESGLFLKAHAQSSNQQPVFLKPKPPVPPKKSHVVLDFRSSPLDDVTNRATKTEALSANRSWASVCPSVDHYRGSPRNPLTDGRLLSATKPIDL